MSFNRGEVWLVNLSVDASGAEIKKTRPCVVVNNDAIGVLPLKIIVPLSAWQDRYNIAPWHIPIDMSSQNGLAKRSTADTFQVRSISESRFMEKIGELTEGDLERINQGLAICLCL
ncbi:MAG: type II toxin-antitoxin system PemK/MazF family toxin [Pelolinea sp.]|nr:type II toxin-antitoxin system PemK/MazF family toxin [Pelolinea sp.]